jgi:homoserine O-succinyltransferase/O-acetyltransferase
MTELPPAAVLGPQHAIRPSARGRDEEIVIGLVNNMSGAAFQMAERQFSDLVAGAAQGAPVRMKTFSLIEPPRAADGEKSRFGSCVPVSELWNSRLDGLIVTGAEPKAASLPEEPFWPFLSRLVDWAEENTVSTIWSCLAAHAAVYHLDGIARRGRTEKLFGLFECANLASDPILAGLPARWIVPHSRFNDLPEASLAARGYRILSRSDTAGADVFVKQGHALHVFLQGHPEYDAEALLREFRRDIRRYLAGESERYPEPPAGCFAPEMLESLSAFRSRAQEDRRPDLFAELPPVALMWGGQAQWRPVAQTFYRNWFTVLAQNAHAEIAAPDFGGDASGYGQQGLSEPG